MKLTGILDNSMGNFLCLRGFASIKDLAKISEPNPDVQRSLIEEHKGEMADFLNRGEYIFFPEVILSMVLSDGDNHDDVAEFREMVPSSKGWSKKLGQYDIDVSVNETKKENSPLTDRIKIAKLRFDENNIKLNRIDGNHRLSAANEVNQDLMIPYCVLLFDTNAENLEFSRAIFHNINSKQIPLKLEENLKVIIESEGVFTDEKFERDPSFGVHYKYGRQILKEVDFRYFPAIESYIGRTKHTFFVELFKYLINTGSIDNDNSAVGVVKGQLTDIENALRESAITATTDNIAVIGALAFYKLTNIDKYRHFIVWIKKNHIGDVELLHIDDVIKIYDKIHLSCPRKAFLARWYPSETHPEHRKAELRLEAIRSAVDSLGLELIDIGTKDTGTFDIRSTMYRSIDESDIFIADLTGARHNVMVEVGYHLKRNESGRMVFYFQETDDVKEAPFDVNGFMYDRIIDSAEVQTKVKPRLQAILDRIKAGEL